MAKYKKKSTESYLQAAKKFLPENRIAQDAPFFLKECRRSKIIDRDNHAYTDYALGKGSLILGHAHRNIVLGIKKVAEKGVNYDALSVDEVNLAAWIVGAVPGVDKAAFFESPKEARAAAVAIAKEYTHKKKVVVFDLGQYVPAENEDSVIILPFNDKDLLEETFAAHKGTIACVVIEAVTVKLGVIPARQDFLETLQALVQKHEAVLIMDEHATGLRGSSEGAQKDFSLSADLICLSGIIGGGFSLAALGGEKTIMRLCASQKNPEAGEGRGISPVILRAGLATVKLLNQEHYDCLNRKAAHLVSQINGFLESAQTEARVVHYQSMMSLFFTRENVESAQAAAKALCEEKYRNFREHLLSANIFFPLAQTDPFFITLMHSRRELQELLTSFKIFFRV